MTIVLKPVWNALPAMLKLQVAVLGIAICTAVVVGTVAQPKGITRVAFALPAVEPLERWDTEVDAFAHRISNAFDVRVTTAREFSGWILEAAERQDLTPELLAGLVLTESSFRKNVRSHVGAVGPAQIRPEYWGGFCGSSNLADPEENIYCGAQILAYYQDACGSEQCALHAYNVGPSTRAKHRVSAGYRYVRKVDHNRNILHNIAL